MPSAVRHHSNGTLRLLFRRNVEIPSCALVAGGKVAGRGVLRSRIITSRTSFRWPRRGRPISSNSEKISRIYALSPVARRIRRQPLEMSKRRHQG